MGGASLLLAGGECCGKKAKNTKVVKIEVAVLIKIKSPLI
jgi:hypothetical protein